MSLTLLSLISNFYSWMISFFLGSLAYCVVLEGLDWQYDALPETTDDWIQVALFSCPTLVLAVFGFIVPIILNPYIIGWPFYRHNKKKQPKKKPAAKKVTMRKDAMGRDLVDIHTYMSKAKELDEEIERAQGKDDVELGSLKTHDLGSTASPKRESSKRVNPLCEDVEQRTTLRPSHRSYTQGVPETQGGRHNIGRQPLSSLTQGAPSRSSKRRSSVSEI